MMQNINECRAFFKQIKSKDVKLSVNIGHLNLAANRFKFNKIDYLNQLKNYIEAFEISNNNGYYDQHKPISPNSWYWSVLRNKDFRNKIMILEYRNVSINKIKQSINIITDMNQQIAAAAEQQSKVAEQINLKTIQIRELSTNTAAESKEIQQQMRSQVEDVKQQVIILNSFKV